MDEGSQFMQYVAATAANLCIIATGAALSWTSPMLARFKIDPVSPDNPLGRVITDDEGSWIGSLIALGAIVGSFLASYLGESIGRKKTMLFSVVPYLIGWALVATTSTLIQLYIARFIFGIALAICFTIVPMYCGEIAETSIRGVLGSFLQLFITVGLLYSYVIGPFVSYTVLWIACACVPIFFFVCFIFMPESPYYLLAKGNKTEAALVLAQLRGKSELAVQKELDEIQVAIDQAYNAETSFSDLFTVRANFVALLLSCAAVSFQQFTGINAVLFYSEDIFKSTATSFDPAICTIIIGCIQLASSGVTPIVVDRLGRRILLVVSGTGTAITTGALGAFFYMKDKEKTDVTGIGWLPITSMVIFMIAYCIGWGPLPWAIMGELFSADVKAKASGITVFVCWGLAFLITKFFSNIANIFGSYTAFWIFSGLCVVSVVFTIFLLPETKGKSLKEIQEELNGKKSSST